MLRALRLFTLLLAASLLSSCDWTGLAYDHLDFLARRYVAGFVDLRPAQQQAFDAAFERLWRWHRSSELPRYATALREFAATAPNTQTPEQIDRPLQALDQFGEALSQHLLGEMAPLLIQLDDQQVAQILKEVDRRIDKSAQRAAKLDDEKWRRRQADETADQLEKYTGPLQTPQRRLLRSWSRTLIRDPDLDARAARVWRRQFAEVLQRRHQAGHVERVQALAAIDDPVIKTFEHQRLATRARYAALLAELSGSYTPQQRQHLATSLNKLAADLDALAVEPPAPD